MSHDKFELTSKDSICNEAIGSDQVDMINRLVEFVNERLTDIEALQIEVNNLKTK